MTDPVERQFGNYRLIRLIGQGGFADVYLSEHVHLNTLAAIKVLRAQLVEDDIMSFRNEARTIAHLSHPNIIRVLEFGVENNVPFLVMEYAPNGTLRQRHPKGTVVPVEVVLPYVKQVAAALQYAHNQKLIHRDIKPENMLLGRNNEVLLSDFGIALVTQSILVQSMRQSGSSDTAAGTIIYMAPEQNSGKPSPASDQYSLGVVVYEWLCGARPFNGTYMEIALQHMHAPPPPMREKVPTISPDVEKVVLTALAKEPQQRFGSIQAFANALEQASQEQATYVASQSHQSSSPPNVAREQKHMEVALHGPSGRTILGPTTLTLGRSHNNQLVINDPKASLRHAEVRPGGQGYTIVDLGSTNGTFVNEQQLTRDVPRPLNQGDLIRIGDTTLTYIVSDSQPMGRAMNEPPTKRADISFPNPPRVHTGYGMGELQEYPTPPPSMNPPYSSYTPSPAAPSPAPTAPPPIYAPAPSSSAITPPVPQAYNAPMGAGTPNAPSPYQQPYRQPAGSPNSSSLPPVQQPYVQQPYVQPGSMPAAPTQRARRGLSGATIGLIALVLILIIASVGAAIFFINRNNQIAATNATATAQDMGTAQAHATGTSLANATATAHAFATATATATPYSPFKTSVLNDPLTSNTSSQWDEGVECTFTKGSYQDSLAQQGHFHPCFAESPSFTDFAYQIEMTIVSGDCGGLIFRAASSGNDILFYVFEVCQDGSYSLYSYASNKFANLINTQHNSSIHPGLNQKNLLAVVMQGSAINLYVNDSSKPIATATDTNNVSAQGHIGVLADDTNSPTTVAYTNARVWTY